MATMENNKTSYSILEQLERLPPPVMTEPEIYWTSDPSLAPANGHVNEPISYELPFEQERIAPPPYSIEDPFAAPEVGRSDVNNNNSDAPAPVDNPIITIQPTQTPPTVVQSPTPVQNTYQAPKEVPTPSPISVVIKDHSEFRGYPTLMDSPDDKIKNILSNFPAPAPAQTAVRSETPKPQNPTYPTLPSSQHYQPPNVAVQNVYQPPQNQVHSPNTHNIPVQHQGQFVTRQQVAAPVQTYAAPIQSHAAPIQTHAAPVQTHATPVQAHPTPIQSHQVPHPAQVYNQQMIQYYIQESQNQKVMLENQRKQLERANQSLEQMQGFFDKFNFFMERVDRRLSNLETLTHEILQNQRTASANPNREFMEAIEQMSQLEADRDLARKLQEELNSDSPTAKKAPEPKKPEPKKVEVTKPKAPERKTESSVKESECPLCLLKFPISEIDNHVNDCLEKNIMDKKDSKTGEPTKETFFGRLFSKKKEEDKAETPLLTSEQRTSSQSRAPALVPTQNASKSNSNLVPYTQQFVPGQNQYPVIYRGYPGSYAAQGGASNFPYQYPTMMAQQMPNGQIMYYTMPPQGSQQKK